MSFRIASWNIEGRLSQLAVSRRGTPAHILQGIEKLRADVIFLPEAYADDALDASVAMRIAELGYTPLSVPYEEGGPIRPESAVHRPSMLLLSKLPIIAYEQIRLGNLRNAIAVTIEDPTTTQRVRIVGVHLDDRSEAFRLTQVPDVVRVMNSSTLPMVVLGDYNAMHGGDMVARLIRSSLARWLGAILVPSLASRVIDMAAGQTLQVMLNKTQLRDADSRHRPTTTPKMRGHEWVPSIRLIQIDHLFVSPAIKTTEFRIAADGGSDHRAISAVLTLDKTS